MCLSIYIYIYTHTYMVLLVVVCFSAGGALKNIWVVVVVYNFAAPNLVDVEAELRHHQGP